MLSYQVELRFKCKERPERQELKKHLQKEYVYECTVIFHP